MFTPLSIGRVHFQTNGCWVAFFIFIQVLKEILFANSGEPDQVPRFVASNLVLHCLPLSQKRTLVRFIWVKDQNAEFQLALKD